PRVLADPARPGNIYVITADGGNFTNDPSDVVIARSTDSGAHWTRSFVDFGPGITFQMFPTAAIDQQGNIVVAWYDNRNGLKNKGADGIAGTSDDHFLLDVFARYSTDGGVTWSSAFQVNDDTNHFDPDAGAASRFSGPPKTTRIGEYFGLAVTNGTAYVAWNGNIFDTSDPANPIPVAQQVWFDSFPIRKGALTVTGTEQTFPSGDVIS